MGFKKGVKIPSQGAGRGNKGDSPYEVQQLQARHREVIRLKMLGEDNKTIAARVGIGPQMVSMILNSQVAVNHMEKLQGQRDEQTVDMTERLIELSQEALDLHEKIVKGEEIDGKTAPLALRARVAGEIMDRGGFGRSSNVNIKSENMHVTASDLDKIKERALERKRRREQAEIVEKPPQTLQLAMGQ